MKTQVEYTMQDAIFKAKLAIESLYLESTELKWLYCRPINSDSEERNRVELHVLEGSPPLGFIIANYVRETVKAFDMHLREISTTCVTEPIV